MAELDPPDCMSAEAMAAEDLEREREWLRDVGVGQRLRETVIDPKLVPDACRTWHGKWGKGASMILAGPVGAGKTVAAIYCLRLIYRDIPKLPAGFRGCKFMKARDLYRAVFNRDAFTLMEARECDVLVIDEWGATYESDWPVCEMDGLIDDRWEDRRATIITTNMHPTDGENSFEKKHKRVYDRLSDEPGPGVVLLDRAGMRGQR